MEKQSKQQLDWIAAAQRKLFIHRQIAGRNPLWYNEKNERGKANVFLDGYFIPGFFFAITAIVVATFVVIFVKGIREWNHNNHSPVLTVPAKVVAKREHRSRNSAAGDDIVHTSTSYYATFEVESGDRMELSLSGREYGLLAQGDVGKLTFQGSRYHRFERTRVQTGQTEEPTGNDW